MRTPTLRLAPGLDLLNRLVYAACVLGMVGVLGLLASLALDRSRRWVTSHG